MMNANTAAYLRLEAMVRPPVPIPIRPRTEAEEDRIAMEDMILHIEGPDSLARYQRRWAAGVH